MLFFEFTITGKNKIFHSEKTFAVLNILPKIKAQF